MVRDTPVHMATDSQSMLRKAEKLMIAAKVWAEDKSKHWWLKGNPFKNPGGYKKMATYGGSHGRQCCREDHMHNA